MHYPWLVSLGTKLTPWALNAKLPVDGIVRKTIFKQFIGGETMEETARVTTILEKFNVDVILDYGVEGKEGEENFEKATEQFIRTVNYVSTQPHIPFISIKVTGLARHGLLQSLNESPRLRSGVHDNEMEDEEWQKVKDRLYRICTVAAEKRVGVLIDAEESWIQDPVDRLTMELMERFNKEQAIVYNTIQLYRHDRLHFLDVSYRIAQQHGFVLGMKLVRGAYMERERERATVNGYPSPIHPDKESTDRDFDASVKYCIERLDGIACIVASHNEQSNLLAVQLMEEKGLPLNHKHLHFSQLLGMSDHITFNLAKAGCSVSKYVPFGPIKDVVPYMMRRAEENSSVAGQTSRELVLIERELRRRKGKM